MISAGDFRNGVTIELEGNIYQIIEFQHVKPGKGAAFVRTKLKNIVSGGVVEKTFRPTEKCPTAHIDRKDMQYLYSDVAQRIAAKHYYRPTNSEILKEYADVFDLNIDLVSIQDFGGWDEAQKVHFSDGGIFDQIYEK